MTRLKSSVDAFENADEDHVLAARMLQLMQPGQHLARVQAVGAAHVFGAGAF